MIAQIHAYGSNAGRHPLFWPYCISLGVHLVLFGVVIFSSGWFASSPSYIPSVIDVQMVDLSQINAAKGTTSDKTAEPATAKEAPKEIETPKETEAPVSVSREQPEKKPEVSVAPVRKTSKSALKYKTFKSEKVLKNALQRVEKKVDSQPPKPLEDTIKRLRDKVAKEGKPGSTGTQVPETGQTGTGMGFGGRGGQKEIELIDLYRLEIGYAVQKNWAFADQLAGGGKQMVASIVFKVMPDGKIVDIFFTDHSGNAYLDDSAYRAIVKTSPVKPFPAGLNRDFIVVGLRFTPKGVR
jgi:colicin import membrane protein